MDKEEEQVEGGIHDFERVIQNLINTGKVLSFINNIIVETEKEKGYDEVVKMVVKRLVENDLYVKPKKYKQKIKKVGFLEVVIGPKGIKIEEKKIKEVLDQPTSKKVKCQAQFTPGGQSLHNWLGNVQSV